VLRQERYHRVVRFIRINGYIGTSPCDEEKRKRKRIGGGTKDKRTVIVYSSLIVVGEERLGEGKEKEKRKDVRRGEN
jgi:hypothetical protein